MKCIPKVWYLYVPPMDIIVIIQIVWKGYFSAVLVLFGCKYTQVFTLVIHYRLCFGQTIWMATAFWMDAMRKRYGSRKKAKHSHVNIMVKVSSVVIVCGCKVFFPHTPRTFKVLFGLLFSKLMMMQAAGYQYMANSVAKVYNRLAHTDIMYEIMPLPSQPHPNQVESKPRNANCNNEEKVVNPVLS